MLNERIESSETITAAADLETNTLVGYDYSPCQSGKPALGVPLDSVKAGKSVSVARGSLKVLVGAGGVAAGDPVVSDASGHVVKASTFAVSVSWGGGAVNLTGDADPPTYSIGLAGSILPEQIIGYARESKLENALCLVRII